MTRETFNKVAAARFSAMVGFSLEAGLMNCKEGIYVSLIAEGDKAAALAIIPHIEGIEYDEELGETFGYVKLDA